jgi:hypothetical protein
LILLTRVKKRKAEREKETKTSEARNTESVCQNCVRAKETEEVGSKKRKTGGPSPVMMNVQKYPNNMVSGIIYCIDERYWTNYAAMVCRAGKASQPEPDFCAGKLPLWPIEATTALLVNGWTSIDLSLFFLWSILSFASAH